MLFLRRCHYETNREGCSDFIYRRWRARGKELSERKAGLAFKENKDVRIWGGVGIGLRDVNPGRRDGRKRGKNGKRPARAVSEREERERETKKEGNGREVLKKGKKSTCSLF